MIYFYYPSVININNQPFIQAQESLESCNVSRSEESSVEQKTIFSPTILLCSSSQEQLPTMETLPKLKNQKSQGFNKKQTKDGDYMPDNESGKRKRKSKQLQNRNVIPNIVRLILSFVQKRGKSEKLVLKLLQQEKCQYATLQRFFNFHKLIKSSMNNYVHQETLAQLTRIYPQHLSVYPVQEQKCYSKITRCLIFHFLRNEAHLCVITSKRMDKIKKRDHLLQIKSMSDRIRVILNQ